MFSVIRTEKADETYQSLKEKAYQSLKNREKNKKSKASPIEGLFKQAHKTLVLLGQNPRHPSLKTHEYEAISNPYHPKKKVFEAYVQDKTPGAYRVFWCYGPGKKEITIIAITPHP